MINQILEISTSLCTPVRLALILWMFFYYLKWLNNLAQQQDKNFEQIELIGLLQNKIQGQKFVKQLQELLLDVRQLQVMIKNYKEDDDKAYKKLYQEISEIRQIQNQGESQLNEFEQIKQRDCQQIKQTVENQIKLLKEQQLDIDGKINLTPEKVEKLQQIAQLNVKVMNQCKNFQNTVQQLLKQINEEIAKIGTESYSHLDQKYLDLLNMLQAKNKPQLNKQEYLIEQVDGQIDRVYKFISNLYGKTSQLRAVDYYFRSYVRNVEDFNELRKNYSLALAPGKELKNNYCDSFRPVRGDGNCFYTAFGFQFLKHLLIQYQQSEFVNFVNHCKEIQLPMKIRLSQDEEIKNEQIEIDLLNEFLNRLIKLRMIENLDDRFEQFIKQFAAYEYQNDQIDGCLYGLSTIFLRNYSNYAVESHELKEALYDRINLLLWETECNSNEIVIDALSRKLKLHTILIYLEERNFNTLEYGNENNPKIILLIKPGHYNIGINSTYEEKLRQNNCNQQLQQQEI